MKEKIMNIICVEISVCVFTAQALNEENIHN